MKLDELDKKILIQLQRNARISNAELARRVNLSPPATLARVKRLEQTGLIDRYATIVARKLVDYDMLCFVRVSLQLHDIDQVEGFHVAVQKIPEVLECHHVTGEYDYLIKLVAHSTEDLERLLVKELTPIPGVAQIHTSLVLKEVKNINTLPIK